MSKGVPAVPRVEYLNRIELSCPDDPLADTGFLLFTPMQARDVDAVAAIERVCFPTAYTADIFREQLADGSRWWVVRHVGQPARRETMTVVAYVGYYPNGHDGVHIAKIATAPQWRRRKLGGWLLLNMLLVAGREGADVVTLEVRATNTAARKFYRRWEFVELKRAKGYYEDTGEDGYILALTGLTDTDVVDRLTRELRRTVIYPLAQG